jgi:hypothetical protein
LKDLPKNIQPTFRNTFIRRIMRLVFSDVFPWSNPALEVYQHEFNLIYPHLHYCLHTSDAVILPTNRDLGVLRNQIGSEALWAVIEYLPSQYTKRMLGSKTERASYITTLLESKQRPFIWEYFRPGTIEIPLGEETYYDQVRFFFSPTKCHINSSTTIRNVEDHSNQSPSSGLSRCTSRHTASSHGSLTMTLALILSVPLHLPPLQ